MGPGIRSCVHHEGTHQETLTNQLRAKSNMTDLESMVQESCPGRVVGRTARAVHFLTTGFSPTHENRRRRNVPQNDEIALDSSMKNSQFPLRH